MCGATPNHDHHDSVWKSPHHNAIITAVYWPQAYLGSHVIALATSAHLWRAHDASTSAMDGLPNRAQLRGPAVPVLHFQAQPLHPANVAQQSAPAPNRYAIVLPPHVVLAKCGLHA